MEEDINNIFKESDDFVSRIRIFEFSKDLQSYLNTVAQVLEYEKNIKLEQRHPQILFLEDMALNYYFNKAKPSFREWSIYVARDFQSRGAKLISIQKHLKYWYAAASVSVDESIFNNMDDLKVVREFDLSSIL